jgi:CubicO group peptidase (beta-lactamase class C family)
VGYSLLAAIVENLSGKTFEQYLDERFFQPLGMARTGYFFSKALHESLAVGYAGSHIHAPISDRLSSITPHYWNLKGNGGMQASAEDMHTWFSALASGPIISDKLREILFKPYVSRADGVAYGYGWFIRVGFDGKLEQVSHTGSDGVFFAAFVWRPTDKFFFYLVTNTGDAMGADVASHVLKILS